MMVFKKPLRKKRFRQLLRSMGPGIITGAADDDPSGIGTYTLAGAQFGGLFLWSALLTWPLMMAVQMSCARIGMVTGEGLASALKKKIPGPILKLICLALFVANSLNVGADLAAMADGMELLHLGPSHLWIFIFGIAISWATIALPYEKIANLMKWLALVLFAYIITVFILKPDWVSILKITFLPRFPQTNLEWGMLVAILGTTITPYLFFWQASLEVEEKKCEVAHHIPVNERQTLSEKIIFRKFDVWIGAFFSNLVMYFIILAAFLTLHKNGMTSIDNSADAARALEPIAGRFASYLFTVGIIGVGLLAIPTLTGSSAYALAEIFKWKQGLSTKFFKAKPFYAAIVASMVFGMILDMAHFSPIKALYWSALVNGILAPFILFAIWLIIGDRQLMKNQPSSPLTRFLIAATTLFMFAAVIMSFI